ncbi:MAG: YcxB family protein [Oscillospiraceae bacterium]|nr:YcxB family protein [Oscillospiraceae bacterium]
MDTVNYVERYFNTDEPVLFEADVINTDKVLYDFNMFAYKHRHRMMYILGMIVFIFAIVSGAIVMFADFSKGLISVIIGIAGILFNRFIFKFTSAKESKSIVKGCTHIYKFYQDYFVEVTNYVLEAIPYEVVVDAYETDEYFYIFISDSAAYILPKNTFVFSTPEEMRNLLTMKLGNRFIVHCA